MNKQRAIFILTILVLFITATIWINNNSQTPTIIHQLTTEEKKVFLPIIMSSRPKIYVGAEYEGGGLTAWATYNNPNTNNKISIYVPDIIDYAYDYDIDWTIPDKKVNNHSIYWIDVKMWVDDPACKLPHSEYWDYYAWIVQMVINRYNPDVIEIWNEPNVFWAHMPENNAKFYGCLGEEGGETYGKFVAHIQESVYGSDIAIGATSTIYSIFVDQMLNGVKESYDRLSFHCYEYFYESSGLLNRCSEQYKYAETLTDKPVHLSETSVIYKSGSIDKYEQVQVEYFERLVNGLKTEWFIYTGGYNGWPIPINCDVLKRGIEGISPRPVWYVYNRCGR